MAFGPNSTIFVGAERWTRVKLNPEVEAGKRERKLPV
jgi:hypothetical protein